MTSKVFDLVGSELRSKGKRAAALWRKACYAGQREAAKAAFLEAVNYGYVPPEVIAELQGLNLKVAEALKVMEHSCTARLQGATERRARLYMCADAIGYAIEVVRSRLYGRAVTAQA